MSFLQHSQGIISATQTSSISIEKEHRARHTAGHDLAALFYPRDPASKAVISSPSTNHSSDVKAPPLGEELTATISHRMAGLSVHRRHKSLSHSVSTKTVSSQRNGKFPDDNNLTDLSFPPSRFEHVFVRLLRHRERRYSCWDPSGPLIMGGCIGWCSDRGVLDLKMKWLEHVDWSDDGLLTGRT